MKTTYLPHVEILPGAEGIKAAYSRSLNQSSVDIVCLSSTGYQQVLGEAYFEDYAKKLYRSPTREILPDSPENRTSAKQKAKQNQVRFLSANQFGESDLLTFGTTVVLISYQAADPYAVCIQDPELVKSFRAQFEGLWQKLN